VSISRPYKFDSNPCQLLIDAVHEFVKKKLWGTQIRHYFYNFLVFNVSNIPLLFFKPIFLFYLKRWGISKLISTSIDGALVESSLKFWLFIELIWSIMAVLEWIIELWNFEIRQFSQLLFYKTFIFQVRATKI